mmetsp:Transcript_93870/g.303814  ORF Transcript_93870/g.303814 Transcript_93870/m.303814 type:complete len:216 (+) Transcript_93870:391-1038(+)
MSNESRFERDRCQSSSPKEHKGHRLQECSCMPPPHMRDLAHKEQAVWAPLAAIVPALVLPLEGVEAPFDVLQQLHSHLHRRAEFRRLSVEAGNCQHQRCRCLLAIHLYVPAAVPSQADLGPRRFVDAVCALATATDDLLVEAKGWLQHLRANVKAAPHPAVATSVTNTRLRQQGGVERGGVPEVLRSGIATVGDGAGMANKRPARLHRAARRRPV